MPADGWHQARARRPRAGLLCLILPACLLAAASSGWAVALPQPPGVPVVPLEVRVELSTSTVQFLPHGRPGLIAAAQGVEMRVTCLSSSWSVLAQGTPLTNQTRPGQIAPRRLFVWSGGTQGQADAGAGPGFVPLDQPIVIAEGSGPGGTTPLEFRLLTDWDDRPGEYTGDIQLTAVARP